MKKISLNLKILTEKFKTNSALSFYAVLMGIVLLEFFILYAAGRQILASFKMPESPATSSSVRFKFEDYRSATERIAAGRRFYPEAPISDNPFKGK